MDEYLRLREADAGGGAAVLASAGPAAGGNEAGLSGAEERAARKQLSATERKLERLAERVAGIHERMAAHDPNDYAGLGRLNDELRAAEAETAELETRWYELSELVG